MFIIYFRAPSALLLLVCEIENFLRAFEELLQLILDVDSIVDNFNSCHCSPSDTQKIVSFRIPDYHPSSESNGNRHWARRKQSFCAIRAHAIISILCSTCRLQTVDCVKQQHITPKEKRKKENIKKNCDMCTGCYSCSVQI